MSRSRHGSLTDRSPRDCAHGHLARSCETCQYEAEIGRLRDGIRSALRDLARADPYTTSVTQYRLMDLIGDDDE